MNSTGLGWRLRAAALAVLCAAPAAADECVITLHGLLRGEGSMQPMADFLMQSGYVVVNQGYPSREAPIADLAAEAIPTAVEACDGAERIHFVTHSLGGILVRQFLTEHTLPNLGRTVMLGPPNGGSEIVDKLGDLTLFEWLNGPAGQELGTAPDSVPNRLGPAQFEVGVIAGTRSIDPVMSAMLPNPDDGRVSVASTKLEGLRDHLVLPVTHAFMMRDDTVMQAALRFLRTGSFAELPSTAPEPINLQPE